VEAALGDMHKTYQPETFRRGATPHYAHSVYGVGQQKPTISGLKDVMSAQVGFALDPETANTSKALFINTGRIKSNPDLEDKPASVNVPDLRFNDFVVFDTAQVKLKYAVLCDFMVV